MNSEKSFYFVFLALFLFITVVTILRLNIYSPQLVFSQAVPLRIAYNGSVISQPVSTAQSTGQSMHAGDFQSKIINPVLVNMHMYSPSSSNLLMGTAIQETMIGKLSKNIFQISLDTAKDVNKYYLSKNPILKAEVDTYYNSRQSLSWNLSNNVSYEVAIARLIYLKTNKPLPNASDLSALGRYWKINYNTYLGKGTAREYVENYEDYIKSRQSSSQYSV